MSRQWKRMSQTATTCLATGFFVAVSVMGAQPAAARDGYCQAWTDSLNYNNTMWSLYLINAPYLGDAGIAAEFYRLEAAEAADELLIAGC